ncbi:MAG: MATE family efflux transporter [Proteobacteria bacterium]|nr:MATE family efflux transporter [Pseudomonadota bacterium]
MPGPIQSTRASTPSWAAECRAILGLSWPLALGNLTQVAMGTTDVMMMGWLSADTIAAGALGANLYFMPFVFGLGLLNAATAMIARTLGRDPGDVMQVRVIVHIALWSALLVAVPFWIVLWWSESLLLAMGQDPALAALAGTYVRALQWALLPSWGFIVLRSFISALERPMWSLVVGLCAIGFNAAANWCLMLGHWGFPALGIAGSGLATSLSNILMALALAVVAAFAPPFRHFRLFSGDVRMDWLRARAFWRLGLPMAATLSFEVTMFNAAVFLMGLIGAAALAAHSIAIQLASLTFMVPLGIGQAATVRVGRALGRRDPEAIRRAGWTALGLATIFMATMALTMVATPRPLISAFLDSNEPGSAAVMRHAVSFLMLAAAFQIADGAQAVGAGILRGLHDTRMPMLFALLGYWAIGLPLSASLAFAAGLGGVGIWIGLAIGLAIVAVLMLGRWYFREALGLVPGRL